ncbi:cyclic lactone autoinducer peptide [Cohnella endophytica]|uniref:Cyclic lactone autoinducer peptide n=1 Tax=Cohnella endophytica TaxID=2419778 RepID=A0A494XGQ3_9BACL|nr:cyclic lactone autoinducer peptide [Cohnella endophytica]RKP49840.1 cyclic lactone autoinducer peptide [Cohnella endophytica]
MKKKLFLALSSLLGGLAVVIVSTASWVYIHQEETPAELLK